MSRAALQQQAFGRRAWHYDDEPGDDDGGYLADLNQLALPHIPEPPLTDTVKSRGEDGGESFDGDSVSAAPNLRAVGGLNGRDATGRIDRNQQDRNLRPVLDQTFPTGASRDLRAPIDEIGTNDFTEICGDALYTAFGRFSAPIKRIAQVANVNERTAKNWWEKKCAPGPIHTLRLMAHVPEFQGRMRELTAMEADLDPELERSLMETIRLMQMRGRG